MDQFSFREVLHTKYTIILETLLRYVFAKEMDILFVTTVNLKVMREKVFLLVSGFCTEIVDM